MITLSDAARLMSGHNLIAIGVQADEARRARHQDRTTFIRVVHVPFDASAVPQVPPDAGELRIDGTPRDLAHAVARIAAVVAASGSVPVTALALHDLAGLGNPADVAIRLKRAGLALIAEAIVDDKRDTRPLVRAAQQAGLGIARLTVGRLTGAPLDLLERVRDLAGEFPGAFRSFAPLPRHVDAASPTTGYDDVKLVALARLYLDEIDTIQVDWALHGPKLAQVALTFGADDLDNVIADAPDANLLGRRRAPLEEVQRNIRAASFVPVQRDAFFQPLATHNAEK